MSLGTLVLGGVDDGIGNVTERPVPGNALPLALAALACPAHRVEDSLLVVVLLAPGSALLTTHGVVVGNPRNL